MEALQRDAFTCCLGGYRFVDILCVSAAVPPCDILNQWTPMSIGGETPLISSSLPPKYGGSTQR